MLLCYLQMYCECVFFYGYKYVIFVCFNAFSVLFFSGCFCISCFTRILLYGDFTLYWSIKLGFEFDFMLGASPVP